MVKRNPHVAKLKDSYLFETVEQRKQDFLAKHPQVTLINLGIGDFVHPLPKSVAAGLSAMAENLSTPSGFKGYGPKEGDKKLRCRIADVLYSQRVAPEEIQISDGILPSLGRLQVLLGANTIIAVQELSYPAYVDTAVVIGQSFDFDQNTQRYGRIVYMKGSAKSPFFPDFSDVPRIDVIYLCSPNNPTGIAATKEQLTELVAFARDRKVIIVYDAAYSSYIRDSEIPKSIYEIEGANDVAIELGSFSKMAGFTGVRLGWSVVPKTLRYDDGTPISSDWSNVYSRLFNGASNIAQAGGLAVLSSKGQEECRQLTDNYLKNARSLKDALSSMGHQCFGGIHCPYVWTHFPGCSSWEAFDNILENAHIVTIPGIGFGPSGEGFLRFSGFNDASKVEQAIENLSAFLT